MKHNNVNFVDKEIRIVLDFVISEKTTKKETIQLLCALRRFLKKHLTIEIKDDYWIDNTNIVSMSVSNSEDVTIFDKIETF